MTTHNSDKDIKQLIDNAGLKQLTKDRLNQVYTDMMEAEKRSVVLGYVGSYREWLTRSRQKVLFH